MNTRVEQTMDAKLLSELNQEIQELHVSDYPTIFKPYNPAGIEDFFSEMLKDESNAAFLVKIEDRIAGYMILTILVKPENAFQFERKTIYIDQILILKDFRKRGIGKRLIQCATDFAREIGADKLQLDHWAKNTEANAFFSSQGFENYREYMEFTI